eukprot:12878398-Ditylum_brightwellii.AAC.1
MVNQHVDDHLNKLDLTMVMHLIIFMSKKGLPLPLVLSLSLQTLKSGPLSYMLTPTPPSTPASYLS